MTTSRARSSPSRPPALRHAERRNSFLPRCTPLLRWPVMSSYSLRFCALSALALSLLVACGDDSDTGATTGGAGGGGGSTGTSGFTAPDREDGDRTPLTDACDDIDAERCLLPWPNDAFTVADPSAETKLRLSVDITRMNPDDIPEVFSRADGFSRVSPIVVSFAEALDASTAEGSIHLFVEQHDSPTRGAEIPLRVEVVGPTDPEDETVVVADPRVPLDPSSTYVVVVDDHLHAEDGAAPPASRATQVAVGAVEAASQAEADLRGHHAPMRRLLGEIGVEPSTVLRAWEFTTRSAEDPRKRLRAMRDAAVQAVDDGDVEVVIESVEVPTEGSVAAIVRGHLEGLPQFLDEQGGLRVGEDGSAVAEGTREAPFRIVIPRGEGDYRMLMFGHGTGGSVDDTSFDETIAAAGAAKVSFEFYGWTGATVIGTFVGMQDTAIGGSRAAGGLVQAVADGSAIRRAMSSVLGETLAADELGGEPNPHAGRHPDDSVPMWVGGSLGGTMGLLFAAVDPGMDYAVLNVPGAAWTSWVRHAEQFRYIEPFLSRRNHGEQRVPLAVAMSQTFFDEADGASWIDVLQDEHPIVALAQESIGDPVLPNAGTEMVARVLGAKIVGEPLSPIDGLDLADKVEGASGLTQYWVEGSIFEVHGFAAEDTPAAAAASEQILEFIESSWAGAPLITVPSGCPSDGCDFR